MILLGVLAALPLLLGSAVWLGQERLIFLPDARPTAAPPGWGIVSIPGGHGVVLVAAGAPGRPVVLHFHGNGGNAQDRSGLGTILNNAGYGVVLAEYRGYGGHPGRPGEAAFAIDAAAVLAWLRDRFPGADVVVWGESLGTGVAARLAEGDPAIAGVILESPFTSVATLAGRAYPWLPVGLLLRHRFEVLGRMPHIAAPVLVVASRDDRLTPADHARQVAAAAPDGRLVLLPDGRHPAVLNDESGQGLRAVLGFLATLR